MSPPPRSEVSYDTPDWDYSTFHYYLVDLGHWNITQTHLPIDAFPRRITLNRQWHNILNYMRRRSQADDRERLTLIGHSYDTDLLYFPRPSGIVVARNPGDTSVDPEDINDHIQLAKSLGIKNNIGYLHSHSLDEDELEQPRLSNGDLFLAASEDAFSLIGVADGNKNIFALRTGETIDITEGTTLEGQSTSSQMDFHEFCNKAHASNIDIARTFNITLYEGQTDGRLNRVYPK